MTRQDVDADGHGDRRPPSGQLLEDLQVHLVGLPAAAPFLRVRQCQQPGLTQGCEDAVGVGLVLLVLVDDRIEHLVGDIGGQLDQFARLGCRQQSVDGHGRPSCHSQPVNSAERFQSRRALSASRALSLSVVGFGLPHWCIRPRGAM